MSAIRRDLVYAAINRPLHLIDSNIHNDIHKQYEIQKQTVLSDKSLTKDEKTEAIKILSKEYDRRKLVHNKGTKRICENCNQECLATTYCEICIRNHLKANFSNWTSGNDKIDNLIRECQMKAFAPYLIVEWIPYDNLQNIKYLTEGGFSKIYTAGWIDGCYWEWDSKEQQLTRQFESEAQAVVLKKLENAESASKTWLEEVGNLKVLKKKKKKIFTYFL